MTSVVVAMATASTEAVTISSLNAAINAAARRGDAREAVEENIPQGTFKVFGYRARCEMKFWF